MNYTLHQLNVFLKVVELKSVTKASEALYMTQPAVSIQLKKIQDQFDLPLTEIINRRIHITEFGYEIYKIAKRILEQVEEMQYTTDSFKGLVSGKLRIASSSTGKYIIPYYLAEYLNQNNSIDLDLDVSNRELVIKSLMENEIDFAFISLPIGSVTDVEEELIVDNYLHMVSSYHQEELDFDKHPLILREKGSATRKQMKMYLNEKGITSKKSIQLTSNEAVKQAICAGLGCSIMPILGAKKEIEDKVIRIHEMEGLPLKSQWRLVWLKQKKLSPSAQGFLDFVREHKASINKRLFSPHLK